MEPNYSSLGVRLANTEHQSWFEGIQGHILCLWLIPTAKSWCFPSLILLISVYSASSVNESFLHCIEALQYQLLSSCYLYTMVMSTLVSTLWCSVAPSFIGKLNNFKSRVVFTFHYNLLRKHTNNPAVEAVICTPQVQQKKKTSHHSAPDSGTVQQIPWALNCCRNQT